MISWLKKRKLYVGCVIVHWIAKDVRKDFLVVALSRLNEDLVGVKVRSYGVYHRVEPIPPYSEQIEYVALSTL